MRGTRLRQITGATIVIISALLAHAVPAARAQQQPPPGAICVSTFSDANGNGLQDAGEGILPGINVNLSTGGAIIATHITTADDSGGYCFENLLRGEYRVQFTDAPTHTFTTPRAGTFALDSGERLTIDPVGALAAPVDSVRATVTARDTARDSGEPLDSGTRLLLATVGSMLVMLFMIGLGVVYLGVTGRRRTRPARAGAVPPPQDIAPPR